MGARDTALNARATSSSRARWAILVAALVCAALTARLGWWQWDRAARKVALQSVLDARAGEPVLGAADLAAMSQDGSELVYRRVLLRGHWLADRTVYLENRQVNGRPGFIAVTPLQWPGGALLVQRGWVARDNDDRTRLPLLAVASGEVEVSGRIAPPPARLYEFRPAATGRIRQNLEPSSYSREIGVVLLPVSLQQEGGTAADGLLRTWPRPALDIHKHYGYAFQWWAMSTLITGLYVWHQILRPRLGRSEG